MRRLCFGASCPKFLAIHEVDLYVRQLCCCCIHSCHCSLNVWRQGLCLGLPWLHVITPIFLVGCMLQRGRELGIPYLPFLQALLLETL